MPHLSVNSQIITSVADEFIFCSRGESNTKITPDIFNFAFIFANLLFFTLPFWLSGLIYHVFGEWRLSAALRKKEASLQVQTGQQEGSYCKQDSLFYRELNRYFLQIISASKPLLKVMDSRWARKAFIFIKIPFYSSSLHWANNTSRPCVLHLPSGAAPKPVANNSAINGLFYCR